MQGHDQRQPGLTMKKARPLPVLGGPLLLVRAKVFLAVGGISYLFCNPQGRSSWLQNEDKVSPADEAQPISAAWQWRPASDDAPGAISSSSGSEHD